MIVEQARTGDAPRSRTRDSRFGFANALLDALQGVGPGGGLTAGNAYMNMNV